MSEIRVPFGIDGNGRVARVDDPALIAAQHLTGALGTTPGERVMRPQYGSLLQSYVFDVSDEATMSLLEAQLQLTAAELVRDARVVAVRAVESQDDPGLVRVQVQFATSATTSAATDTVTLTARIEEN